MEIRKQVRKFVIRLITLTALLCFTIYGGAYLQPAIVLPSLLPILLAYFFVFTLVVHGVLVLAAQDRTEMSITYFMATITGKLILSLMVVGGLAYFFPEQMIALVIWFFILYIVFTVFEIISLLPILQANNRRK